jgi:hypothetical protein
MKITPTPTGGRELTWLTPWGQCRVVVEPQAAGRPLRLVDDAGRVVGTAEIGFSEPPRPAPRTPTPELLAVLETRADICTACPRGGPERVTRMRGPLHVWTVECSGCKACGGRLALNPANNAGLGCPENKWPKDTGAKEA